MPPRPFPISSSSLLIPVRLELVGTFLANRNENSTLIANRRCNSRRSFGVTSNSLTFRNIPSISIQVKSRKGLFGGEHSIYCCLLHSRLLLLSQASHPSFCYYSLQL